MRIATFNTEWASPRSAKGKSIREMLTRVEAEVLVVTEAVADVLPSDGYVIDAGGDWGYKVAKADRRKVLMWSQQPWADVVTADSVDACRGRYVEGSTHTSIGELTILGVCIPWSHAHVSTGRRDRQVWEAHRDYLKWLTQRLEDPTSNVLVAGDMNQRIPRVRAPEDVYRAFRQALNGLTVPTVEADQPDRIDHIAHGPEFTASEVQLIPGLSADPRLSDHDGVVVELNRTG